MIDRICESLERQARESDRHDVGGFTECLLLGEVRVLRMDCRVCDFFAIVDPETGRHIQSMSGVCPTRTSLYGAAKFGPGHDIF